MKYKRKLITAIVLLMILLLPAAVHADVGPKPSINIYVKNSTDKAYYLYIMEKDEFQPYSVRAVPDNMYIYREGEWSTYLFKEPGEISGLKDQYSLVSGMRHHFVGFYNQMGIGLPNTFRIILQYETGEIVVSNPITDKGFTRNIIYDAKKNEAMPLSIFSLDYYKVYFETIKMLFLCIMMTLFIELLIAVPFKIRPFKVLIITNIVSQIALFAAVFLTYIPLSFFLPIAFFIYEIIIWCAEYLVYKKFANKVGRARLILYVLTANISSMLAGIAALFITAK